MEVADVLHAQGEHFLDQHPWLSVQQRTVLRALRRCRTAVLGGHVDQCGACGHRTISYNSCRNRHCPKCQAQARARWLAARERELLDVPYVHVVFTLPHALLPLGYRNATQLYTWLFQASAATLREVAADPRHLGAEIGVLSILHTWGQTLVRHPHVHCVVPAGGLSPDRRRWIRPKVRRLFLPIKVLSRVFRGKFVAALRRAYVRGDLDLAGATEGLRDPTQWHTFVDALFETDWVVYAKPAFGGASAVLRYLGRYTHRVAIEQSPLDRLRWGARDLLVEGLRPRPCAAHDDAHRDGVSPALGPARAPTWFRPHSAVWISRQPVSHRAPRGRPARHLTVIATRGAVLDTARLALSAMRSADGHRPDPLGAPAGHCHTRLRHLMTRRRRPDRHLRRRGGPRVRCGVPRSRVRPRPLARRSRTARPAEGVPPPLPRRRPLGHRLPTLGDPASSSIAGRRASGFLQVSLSKVPRPQHRAAISALCAEALPINASDYTLVIRCVRVLNGSTWLSRRHEALPLLGPGSNNTDRSCSAVCR